MNILDWFKKTFNRLFKRKKAVGIVDPSTFSGTAGVGKDSFMKLTEFLRNRVPKSIFSRHQPKPARPMKKRGRGYTKPPYNFKKVKMRRKMAKASQRRNRGVK